MKERIMKNYREANCESCDTCDNAEWNTHGCLHVVRCKIDDIPTQDDMVCDDWSPET